MANDSAPGFRGYGAGISAVAILFVLWRVFGGGPSHVLQIDYQWVVDIAEGAEVLVDGRSVGRLELLNDRPVNGFEVEPGEHIVDLRVEGCTTTPEKVTLGPARIAVLVADVPEGSSGGRCRLIFR